MAPEPGIKNDREKTENAVHRFPKLPAELQAAVWRQAMPRIWGHEFKFTWKVQDDGTGVTLFEPSTALVQDTLPTRW